MVKKGKEKSTAPASGGSAKKGPAEDDFIVFTNSTKESKPKKGVQPGSSQAGPSSAAPEGAPNPNEPPKPTVKQIIGGQSWTGKLPVNLLSEHCQKMKWQRPDYDTRKFKEGFSVFVSLSAKNNKTGEMTKLDPFKLPSSHVHLAYKPTALEAKHFAATYALFRVCSMKNLHMMLPPDYKALWKDFEALKKQDVKEGKAWMYEADPFEEIRQRAEAKVAAEKKRKQQEAVKEKAANLPGAAGLVLRSNAVTSSGGGGFDPMKGWNSAPKIDMGSKTRANIEDLLRRGSAWNPHGIKMSASEKAAIVKELKGLGFRVSHVEEAVEECKDREETLEWLLIHVPEDDLPRWALPESYTAGISVGATDLRRDGAIQRLASTGYSIELCKKVFDSSGGDEGAAAERLQSMLLASGAETSQPDESLAEGGYWGTAQECWDEETAALEAVFAEQCSRPSADVCQLRLLSVINGPQKDFETSVQFRKSPHYPSQTVVSVLGGLAAYLKLSIIRKSLAYADESLQGEAMKINFMFEWIQQNINDIIETPGPLRDISAVASAASGEQRDALKIKGRRPPRHPKPIRWITDNVSRQDWLQRQESPAYVKMLVQRQKLPAWQVRQLVVDTVSQHQVTIISGETGSGKSTQSVQFILDELYSKGLGTSANMIVTQPRRISALGLADRVSEERCSRVGQEVGFAIRGENKTSHQTRITFVTTGILLRRLQVSGGRIEDVVASLADVSHVVIDEVHERSLDTDFLLSILRDVLRKRRDLKLILMSATLDSSTFKNYFAGEGIKVGMVEIAGRTYPVEDFYLDDIIRATGFRLESVTPGADAVAATIQKLGMRINYDLLVDTAKAIDEELSGTKQTGGILVFLPGVAEIDRTCRLLQSVSSLHVLPLHASLQTKDQKRVFAPPPPGKRKVVVATNVAETSITIDDIVAVIDSGRVKETSFDVANNMRKLEETWTSLAAGKQRRGRAGRVQAGQCYKLYTRNLEQQMATRPDPEIRRVPLEQLCLSVRSMGIKDVSVFLSRTPTPPEATAVEGAIKMLRRMGALDGDELTALGQQLAMIPADLRCGKLMVFGAIFGCLDECVTIAAILSTRSPFVSPADKRTEAKEAKMQFARGDGDLLTDLRAFQEWDALAHRDRLPQRQIRAFCDASFLSYQTLSDIASTRTQYYSALSEIGIVAPGFVPGQAPATSTALLRAVTASAFSPQIVRVQFPDKKFLASMSGAIELEAEARTIRYYAQEQGRVFVHPASTLFDAQGFSGSAAFLSYFTMMSTSKIFMRDLTPFNPYTLLLFSGAIELDTLGRGLVVDGWLRLRGWARIGVLVSRLRGMVDNLIAMKVDDPTLDLADNDVIRAVVKLLELDGMDA